MNSSQSYISIFLRNQLKDKVCSLCLSQNRHYVNNEALVQRVMEDFPKLLEDFDVHEDRMCWECNARIKQFISFYDRVKQAKETLNKVFSTAGKAYMPILPSMSTLTRSCLRGKVHILPMTTILHSERQTKPASILKDAIVTMTPQNHNATSDQINIKPVITSVSTLSQNSNQGKIQIVPISNLIPRERQTGPSSNAISVEFEEMESQEYDVTDDQITIKDEPIEEIFPKYNRVLDLDEILSSMYVQKPTKLFKHSPELNLPKNLPTPLNKYQTSANFNKNLTIPANSSQITVTSGPSKLKNAPKVNDNDIKITILSKKMVMELREKERVYLTNLTTGFNCDKCIFNIDNEEVYKNHMNRHDPSAGAEVCDICEMRFKDKEALTPHYKSHFRAYACGRCRGPTFVCRLWNTMAVHMKGHEACSVCGVTFKTKELLKAHVITHQVDCPKCKQKFKSQARLDNHSRSFHTEIKCDKCNMNLKGLRALKMHQTKNKDCDIIGEGVVIAGEDGSSQPYCVKCDKFYKTRTCLTLHMKTGHHADNKYECDSCGKTYTTKVSLVAHIQFTHDKKGLPCRTCGKKFASKCQLKTHENYVHLKKRTAAIYTCDVCGKPFTTKSMLKIHQLIHSGVRQFQCELCPWNFTQKSTLSTHMRLKHKNGKNTESGAVKPRQKRTKK